MENRTEDKILTKSLSHPLKNQIKIRDIKQLNIAVVLGCPIHRLSRWLNGYDKMPKEIETKIKDILRRS